MIDINEYQRKRRNIQRRRRYHEDADYRDDVKARNREYYENHISNDVSVKERYNSQRRRRYQEDADYREAKKAYSKKYYYIHKTEQ